LHHRQCAQLHSSQSVTGASLNRHSRSAADTDFWSSCWPDRGSATGQPISFPQDWLKQPLCSCTPDHVQISGIGRDDAIVFPALFLPSLATRASFYCLHAHRCQWLSSPFSTNISRRSDARLHKAHVSRGLITLVFDHPSLSQRFVFSVIPFNQTLLILATSWKVSSFFFRILLFLCHTKADRVAFRFTSHQHHTSTLIPERRSRCCSRHASSA
jgi:hypothetical protein